jgi:hypothetical protein
MNPSQLHLTGKQKLLLSLLLGVIALSSVSPILRPTVANASSSSSLLPLNLLSGQVTSWNLVQGMQNPQFSIATSGSLSLPVKLPTIIYVHAWLTYNGQTYWSSSYSIALLSGHSSGATTIKAPYLGPGDYTFYAKLSVLGILTTYTIIDPRIDPDW